jgi:hypothetical protein
MQKRRPPVLPALCALLSLAALGACADNPMKDMAQAAGIGGEPKPAPDFITRTRAAHYDYMPIGEAAPKRSSRPKNAAGVTEAEASMDAVRTRNEARGRAAKAVAGAVEPPAPVKLPPTQ